MDVLLSLSNEYAYFRDRGPVRIQDLGHDPWFWAIPRKGQDAEAVRRRIQAAWEQSKRGGVEGDSPLAKIKSVGELETVRSFVAAGVQRPAFKVATNRSYFVPEVSDELFVRHDVYTAEHDVPYQQRACVDLAAAETAWAFDTKGEKTRLKVLVYDIETTQYGHVKNPPIDIIGHSSFEISYSAAKDVAKEEFHFEMVDAPPAWSDCEVKQLVARTPEEEVENLAALIQEVTGHHIVSGHNILSFDNLQVFDRIRHYQVKNAKEQTLGRNIERLFDTFAGRVNVEGGRVREETGKWASRDRLFSFGQQSETVNFHRTSLDTYHAARRFYFFLDDFTLKKVAPFLGVNVPGRVYLSPADMKLDDRTMVYNKHDCQEQLGITMLLLAQALPLAFTTGWTFEEVLTGGNVRMWDHMAMIRAARQRKLMPATCRAQGIARTVLRNLGTRPTKELIADDARVRARSGESATWLKEYVRVAKYGDEMPDWVELPHVIVNPKMVYEPADGNGNGEDEEREEEEYLAYAIPGGMTIHPQEVGSHFVPWYHVIDADVGAMYPTILRARNVGPDTVRLARAGETPDDWIWFYKLPEDFTKDRRFVFRATGPEDTFAQPGQGVMVGICVDKEPGLVPSAMKGIMGIATKLKRQVAAAKKNPATAKSELDRLQMGYASIKALRNAGTHGQMLAVNVSCRGFNLWAGGEITTIGQKILSDSLVDLKARNARVVYGDSVVGSRCIVVRDPKGRIQVQPIEELYNRVGGAHHAWHGKDAVLGNGWEALSMDPESPEDGPSWKPIKRLIRHATTKNLVRIGQTTGGTVCTTDHSLMVRDGARLQRAAPEALRDVKMVRARCPRNEAIERIDLVEYLGVKAMEMDAALGPNLRTKVQAPRFRYDDETIWFAEQRRKDGEDGRALQLRRHVKVDSEAALALCRLMGAYAAEGSVTFEGRRFGASIANTDVAWLEGLQRDLGTIFENMDAGIIASSKAPRTILLADGRKSTYVDSTQKMQMTNLLATLFFWALGGKGSDGKRIPSFVFNLPRRHQEAFLERLVEGDGSRAWGPRYSDAHARKHFRYTTKSLQLASGLCVLLDQLGVDYAVRHDSKKVTYVMTTREKESVRVNTVLEPVEWEPFVYDLEVEANHTFVDAFGSILLHNTDGIYVGCSRSGKNLMHLSEALGVESDPQAATWLIQPDDALEAIADLNKKWRAYLGYEEFELEAGSHDAMVFVVHKNYLIFDVKKGKLRMTTKGNNFRGSDKAPIAQKLLEEIMTNALRDNIEWQDEEKARQAMRASIRKWTAELVKGFDINRVELEDLTLVQVVQPIRSYKPNPDGSPSVWMKRAAAIQRVTGEELKASKKYRFVVCKQPLEGLGKEAAKETAAQRRLDLGIGAAAPKGGALKSTKPGMKPLDFMWPIDHIKSRDDIDLDWYKDMLENYVRGAFGLDEMTTGAHKEAFRWM